MPGQGRLGDAAKTPSDAHGCPSCPHAGMGPAVLGSPNVNVNGLPALRVGDGGMHAACCATNRWTASHGSASVFINGKPAFRAKDPTQHCGGLGQLVQGSANVIVGDGGGGGGGGSSASSTSTPASAGTTGAAHGAAGSPAGSAAGANGEGAAAGSPQKHWIEVQLLDDAGGPVAGEPYVLTLADGTRREGRLDHAGRLRHDDLATTGNCRVSFPRRDEQLDPEQRTAAKAHFVEIALFDAGGRPLAGEPWVAFLPDWTRVEGRLDESGTARIESRAKGEVRVRFPDRDAPEIERGK